MNYIGSIRYDQHGRKRKTKAMSVKKPLQFKPTGNHVWEPDIVRRVTKEYPSAPMTACTNTHKDDSWKLEASKNFTVAPAYNKGAYQVIPKADLKHIGR